MGNGVYIIFGAIDLYSLEFFIRYEKVVGFLECCFDIWNDLVWEGDGLDFVSF